MDEVREIIVEAGKILRDKYISSFMVHEKEKGHLAVDVDMEVELFLKEQLYKIDSSVEFYGEETGRAESGLDADFTSRSPMQPGRQRWIVDSLDGTANFIFGVPYFCTSIALEREGRIISAAVYNPVTEELFEAYEEKSRAFCNGVPIHVSTTSLLHEASEPSKEYYDEYKNVSARLREASDFLAEKIKERGFNAFSLAHERQNKAYRTQLPFKTLATRAGLGWIGKSAVLITKEYGNAIRLNGVLTDMPIKVGTPVNESLCGECEQCVKHCPGHAIAGNTWRLHMGRDILLDAVSCKKAVIERGKVFNVNDGTCGICISVCPWTKRYRSEPE